MDPNVITIVYRYLHELNTQDLKKELLRNIKTFFILKLKISGLYSKNQKDYEQMDKLLTSKYHKNLLYNLYKIL